MTMNTKPQTSASPWKRFLLCCLSMVIPASSVVSPRPLPAAELRVTTFSVDATPQVGSPLAYDPMVKVTDRLLLKGIVIVPDGQKPIVLCAVDWLGVACSSNDSFCASLAEAVNSTPDRVVMHALHQHDAPRCNHDAITLLAPHGIAANHFDVKFLNDVIERAAQSAMAAMDRLQIVTSIKYGQAPIHNVASNRRMLSPDGTVHVTRYTACKDPKIASLPVGVIDPLLRIVTFQTQQGTGAALTFYATHPQSFYRVGEATPDFPGLARDAREAKTKVFHLHFNGAGGNIGAGKYNDGSRTNRPVLAARVESGMQQAWESRAALPVSEKQSEVAWKQVDVLLPLSEAIDVEQLEKEIANDDLPSDIRCHAAEKLAYARRVLERKGVPVSRLKLGDLQMIFMPGELFVEYQLAASAMCPKQNILMAAYGDYGTQYIGTRVAYPQGGYEVSPRATNVSPGAEAVLIKAMEELLSPTVGGVKASDFTDRMGPGLSN